MNNTPALAAPHAAPLRRAAEVATNVADRMATVVDVGAKLQQPQVQPLVPGWPGASLAGGYSGISLLHLYAARHTPDPCAQAVSQRRAFESVRLAVRHASETPIGPGLWDGLCGLALALAECCRDEPHFAPTLAQVHAQLAGQVLATRWPREVGNVAVSDYDLISGAAGTLVQLCAIEDPSPSVRTAVEFTRDYLLWLSEPERGGSTRWRWLMEFRVPEAPLQGRKTLPRGYLDVGMAHGAAGVLTALAAAWRAGYRCRRQLDAMYRLTLWILEVRALFNRGGTWPAFVPVTETGAQGAGLGGEQIGWCYGSTGLASALLSTAEATNDNSLRQVALDTFDISLRRSTDSVDSQSLCHGLAGLIVGCRQFADAGSAAAKQALPMLADRLLERIDANPPFTCHDPREPQGTTDELTLLNGVPGMALALLAAADSTRPDWFSALLGC
ncbi:lanthionine synthetase C family protein [Streptomyces kronopolitis]|uniref:lanthionine synthetase C family protein n=1 Tax=Streptomyces kronopolitis TaxID=1612435 RepID=UPI0036AC8826